MIVEKGELSLHASSRKLTPVTPIILGGRRKEKGGESLVNNLHKICFRSSK